MALQDPNSKSILSEDKKTGLTYKGQEIVLSKKRGKPPNYGKMLWGIPDEKKIEVVTIYAVVGNVQKTSDLTDVSPNTIRAWRKEEWFRKILDEIRDENDEKIDVKFTEIVEKALDQVLERLEKGETVVTKGGELVTKPLSARDLALISAIMVDKRNLLRGRPTTRTETVTNAQQLEKLATQFADLANKRRPQVIDVQDVEVIDGEPAGGVGSTGVLPDSTTGNPDKPEQTTKGE